MASCGVPDCSAPDAGTGVCAGHRREEQAQPALFAEEARQWDEEDRRNAVPCQPLPPGCIGGTPYGRAVLEGTLRRLGGETEPGRNIALTRAGYLVGGYCAGGELDPHTAAQALLEGAKLIGLGAREGAQVIARAMHAGGRRPLQAPSR